MKLERVKHAMAYKETIEYQGIEYSISAVTMRIYQGKWYYQAELQSLHANSIVIAALEDVNEKEIEDVLSGKDL